MKAFLLVLLVFGIGTVHAVTTLSEQFSSTASELIQDDDLTGFVRTIKVSSNLTVLNSVRVVVETTGGWNGDLYAYLWHDGVICILLNRPGRTLSLPDGSATSGMVLEFSDTALIDVHNAVGPLNGIFQPDGRNVHPLSSLDSSPRTDRLSDFIGTSPNGAWRLFIADVSPGEEATLTGWSVILTGSALVPEPGISLLLAGTLSFMLLRRRKAASNGMSAG